MMKQYHCYVFTQDGCPPCERLKDHIKTLSDAEKSELDFVPLKTESGVENSLDGPYDFVDQVSETADPTFHMRLL